MNKCFYILLDIFPRLVCFILRISPDAGDRERIINPERGAAKSWGLSRDLRSSMLPQCLIFPFSTSPRCTSDRIAPRWRSTQGLGSTSTRSTWGQFCPPGNIWQHLEICLSSQPRWEERYPSASSGERPGMWLNTLQCRRQTPHQNESAQSISQWCGGGKTLLQTKGWSVCSLSPSLGQVTDLVARLMEGRVPSICGDCLARNLYC